MGRRLRLRWPEGGLWRHADFLKLWSGQTVSQVGSQVSALALPLAAVLVLDASAFEVATLGAVEFLPFLLFALPAGVWVDARNRVYVAKDRQRRTTKEIVADNLILLGARSTPAQRRAGASVTSGLVREDVDIEDVGDGGEGA